MNKRFHKALRRASELRALYVLLIVLVLHARRRIQIAYSSLPSAHELIQYAQCRVNVKITYYLYPVHWIGTQ